MSQAAQHRQPRPMNRTRRTMASNRPGGNFVPSPSENDYVAAVAAQLRRVMATDDIILEERVIGSRRRKDIVVRRLGKIILIIEVKRPEKFKTTAQRTKANKQVAAYAKSEGCNSVGITDGHVYIAIDLTSSKWQERELLADAKSAFRSGYSPTPDRPGWTPEEYLLFPERQRQKHPLSIPKDLYVPRQVTGFNFTAMFRSRNPVHIILGLSDVGKSALSWTLAESPEWNAIRLDGVGLTDGVEAAILRDIVSVYERPENVVAFLQRVAEVSLSERGVPFGVVLDGFDDWMAVSSELHDLPSMIDRLSSFNCKIVILSRPSEKHRLLNSTLLERFTDESEVVTLGELDDEQLEQFIQTYFTKFRIGGTLTGSAREICRSPAMLAIVSETFAESSGVDADLDVNEIHENYIKHKATKLALRYGGQPDRYVRKVRAVADYMREHDMFAIRHSDLKKVLTDPDVEALTDAGLLVPVQGSGSEEVLQFPYGNLRNYLVWKGADSQRIGIENLLFRPMEDDR